MPEHHDDAGRGVAATPKRLRACLHCAWPRAGPAFWPSRKYPAIVRALDGGGYRGREGVDRFHADTSENWEELQSVPEEFGDLGEGPNPEVLAAADLFAVVVLAIAAAPERQPRLVVVVSMKKGGLSNGDGGAGSWASRGLVVGSGAHLSIASSSGGPGVIGGRLRGRNSKRAVRRPDEEWRLPEREQRAGCW